MTVGPTVLRWLPAVAWAALIFAVSSIPDLRVAPEPLVDLVVRKIGHAAVYAVLAVLVHRALGDRPRRQLLAWLIAAVYAATDELHQAFVPGRGPSPLDVGVDALGAAIGMFARALALTRLRGGRWVGRAGASRQARSGQAARRR